MTGVWEHWAETFTFHESKKFVTGLTKIVDPALFWDVTPSGRVETYRRFGGVCCLHLYG
jgi:hypothetical protein